MLTPKPKSRFPERRDPGDPEPEWCSPGSIEQQLDMCEEGELRGDEILHLHGVTDQTLEDPLLIIDPKAERYRTLQDPEREETEMTGDSHSKGLQGEEQEIENQLHLDSGVPGEESDQEEEISGSRTPLEQ